MVGAKNEEYNTLSILALVFMFVFAPMGIILGVISLRQINKTGEQGKSLATFAVWFPIAIGSILLIFWFIGLFISK